MREAALRPNTALGADGGVRLYSRATLGGVAVARRLDVLVGPQEAEAVDQEEVRREGALRAGHEGPVRETRSMKINSPLLLLVI